MQNMKMKMLNIFMLMICSFLLLLIFYIMSSFSYKSWHSLRAMTKVECGYPNFTNTSLSFSLPVFTIMMLFIVFDLETLFLINLFFKHGGMMMSLCCFFLFVFGTLYLEWYLNKINWQV